MPQLPGSVACPDSASYSDHASKTVVQFLAFMCLLVRLHTLHTTDHPLLFLLQLVSPCIHERDMYLAWSLKRSKAVNGCKTVVGVVGKGHLRGITWVMLNTAASDGLRFRDLVGRRPKPSRGLQKFVLETAVVTGLYIAWTTYVQ